MRFFCVLTVICGCVLSVRALDRKAFTFTSYDLNARIEPEQQRLGVRGKIVLRNDSEIPQKNIELQISSTLNWSSIQFEGKPVEFVSQTYASDIDHTGALSEAIVVLPHSVAPKQSAELEIGYEGVIPQDTTRLTRIGVPADTAKHSDWDEIGPNFTAVRGVGYVAWYPIATEAASLSEGNAVFQEVGEWKQRESQAAMHIAFVDSGSSGSRPSLYCNNGVARVTRDEEMGRAYEIHSECSFPLGDSVPVFVIGSYANLDKPEVSIYYPAEFKSDAENYAASVEQVSPFLNKLLGEHRQNPGQKAQVIALPNPADAPFQSGNLLLAPLSGSDTALLLSAIQQLTHVVFPSPHRWISDGLASFAQAAYMQQENGRQAALVYLEGHRSALVESEKENAASGGRSTEESLINSADEFYVETKAMNVWWMLRDMVGDPGFSAALHSYDPASDKDAYYMEKLIEAQAHHDLSWFFDDWVYRDRGLPSLRIVSVYPRPLLRGGFLVTVTVENSGEAAAEVPTTLRMESGETSERLIVRGKSDATIRIECPAVPLEAVVNDGGVPEASVGNHVYKIEGQSSSH